MTRLSQGMSSQLKGLGPATEDNHVVLNICDLGAKQCSEASRLNLNTDAIDLLKTEPLSCALIEDSLQLLADVDRRLRTFDLANEGQNYIAHL